ncbi:MAG: LPS-assembly protein LptD [Alphaproteobacteria bacterium]
MIKNYKNIVFSLFLSGAVMSSFAFSTVVSAQNNNAPVDLQADRLIHDENGQTVTATGDVVLIQDGRTVKADEIVYNLMADTVIATGNVEYTDVTGDKHYADRVEFNNALKDGFAEGLKTFLTDGSRFKASNGEHIRGNKTIMKDAFYTPCEPCKTNPDAAPIWQIRASEVEHDKESKTISYRNARFEIAGVPVGYMPYFEHPDGTVKRKSGFLTPSAGYTSELGGFVQSSYYWSIAPDKDLTASLMVMTDEVPLGMLEWRQRWENASLKANGTFTYSSRTDRVSGSNVAQNEEVRGNVSAQALWDINNKWRAGADIDVSSDDQYLRQYDLTSEDVLYNEFYLERFSGRSYSSARVLAFQDLRIAENRQDQPHVLPEIQASFLGEQGGVPIIGGRWSFDASLLGLVRDENEQDVNRAHTAIGWQRKLVSDYGFVTVLDASGQATFYDVNDRTGSGGSNVLEGNSRESRAHAYINAKTSYPMTKNLENSQIIVEPVAAIKLSPRLDDYTNYPNEDSQDVQLDSLNVFNANRFPGIDGAEDGSHTTYGLRTGVYAEDGSYGNVFVGQSYRFNDKQNPFTVGSGLENQSSDFVGQVSGGYKNDYSMDYRFQMDDENFSSQRHEVDASMKISDLTLNTQYLYAKGLGGTDIDETREQITNGASYYINDKWRLYGSARHDLGVDPGLRTAGFGVDYTGQCISLSVIGQRNLTDDSSGDSGTEVFLRIGFKNLGEFETSGVQIGGQGE